MKLMGALIAAMVALVAIAGCIDGEPQHVNGAVDQGGFTLAPGTGAIAGLLVDDRFRPIELTQDPITEFQRTGFILLQELGLQTESNANGEFTFVDIEPGTYTLRVQADGHEATPSKIVVEEGYFAESTLVARRTNSAGSSIITQEHTVYIDCAFSYVQSGGNGLPPHVGIGCDGDLSQDGYSSNFIADYSSVGPNATWMVTEMLANQAQPWELQIRGSSIYATEWARGDYLRVALERGMPAPDYQDNPSFQYGKWQNSESFQTILFVDHDLREEHQQVTGGMLCCGVGASIGIRALILQSVFIGPPEVALDTYCLLC